MKDDRAWWRKGYDIRWEMLIVFHKYSYLFNVINYNSELDYICEQLWAIREGLA